MRQLNAYLSFNGNCAEAMRFYERALRGKLEKLLKVADVPAVCDQMPPGSADRVMHAFLVTDNGVLMAGDAMPGQVYEGMKGFSLTLTYPTTDEAKQVYDALSEGGKVTMPFQKTFWAESSGMLTDRFGTPWIVNGKLNEV